MMQHVTCPKCSKESSLKGFAKHYAKAHGDREPLDLYLELVHKGPRPMCKCGCEQETTFYGFIKGFAEYIRGHKDPSKRSHNYGKGKHPREGDNACPFSDCARSFFWQAKLNEHLANEHGIGGMDAYIKFNCDGVKPVCACGAADCPPLTWHGWQKGFTRFARGHNAKLEPPIFDEETKTRMIASRKKTYAEKGVWNSGLTKETDERIAKMSEKTSRTLRHRHDSGDLVDWSKKDPEKKRNASLKQSNTKREMNLVPWNKGKTKYDSGALASVGQKNSETRLHDPNLECRLTIDGVLERIHSSAVFEPAFDANFQYQNKYQRLPVRCKVCNKISEKTLAMLNETPICFHCHPKSSKGELEIFEFVRSIAPDAMNGDRTVITPKELDVWVPSAQLGIEYDGLYYHSDPMLVANGRDPMTYHQEKFEACAALGIHFFSVFEDEWKNKRSIIEGMLRNRLGVLQKRLSARDCAITNLSSNDARAFFETNHLEGHAQASIYLGLIHPEEGLVAAVSLRRPMHKAYAGMHELARSCCRVDVSVRGWLGKLSKSALLASSAAGKDGMITYVDCRIGLGDAYSKAGWQFDGHTKQPRFWWTNYSRRFNRFECKADSSRGMSEDAVAHEKAWVRIHACKNSRFSLTQNQP